MEEPIKKISIKIPMGDFNDLEAINMKWDKPSRKYFKGLILRAIKEFLDKRTKELHILRGTGEDDPEYVREIMEKVGEGYNYYG